MHFRGVFPPIATPFTAAGDLDLEALRFNATRWMQTTRLRGLVVLGSNGEAAFIDDDEAEQIVAATRPCVPSDRVLIAGTGRDSTRATITACVRAARAGADVVLVRPPTAFKAQMTGDALLRHYTAVADASPVPVLLYNFAAAFGTNLPTETIVALAGHRNIIGLKESGGDLLQIADQVSRTPDTFTVVVGSAPTLYPSLCVGVDGAVVAAANVIPELMVDLYEATTRGDHATALGLQRAISPLAKAVTSGYGVAGLKAAMELAGYRGEVPRAPLGAATPRMIDDLRALIAALPAPSGASHVPAAR